MEQERGRVWESRPHVRVRVWKGGNVGHGAGLAVPGAPVLEMPPPCRSVGRRASRVD